MVKIANSESQVQHMCKALEASNVNISIEKLEKSWFWIFWNDKRDNEAHGIKYCPYCGEKLKEVLK